MVKSIDGQNRDGFDAFISYSHAMDDLLAPALQRGLHTFRQALEPLAGAPDISRQLQPRRGAWPVVRYRPSSWRSPGILSSWLHPRRLGRSGWGGKLMRFLNAHPAERLIIVVTDGELHWSEEAGDFLWEYSTPLPSSLRGQFADEPRWIDAKWAREQRNLSLANPRFLELVADVAAPLHGRSKDELIGEDVFQHRRTRRTVRAALATLTMLTVVSILASIVALIQRNESRHQARLATSRELAATADREASGRGWTCRCSSRPRLTR